MAKWLMINTFLYIFEGRFEFFLFFEGRSGFFFSTSVLGLTEENFSASRGQVSPLIFGEFDVC